MAVAIIAIAEFAKMLNYTFTLDDLQLCDKRDFEGRALLTYEAHSSLQRVMLVTVPWQLLH